MKKRFIFLLTMVFCLSACGQKHPPSRSAVEFSKIQNSTVLFTFGQSNSANHGRDPYTPRHAVYNYFKGNLYMAQDPLLGATGKGGSVWGILGDKMIENKMAQSVTIIPIGVGGVSVGAWAEGGACHQRLLQTIDELNRKKVKIDCICWHQGETDNIENTSTENYIKRFLTIREAFRSRGIQAPIVVAVASYHPLCVSENKGCSEEIRKAQKTLAKRYSDIYLGPDTDQLDHCYQRADGVHFSRPGQLLHADMWLKCLRKVLDR